MPSKNPRLTITLEPQLGAYLRRLSELTGNSQSMLVHGLLENVEPVFVKMIKLLESARLARDELQGKMRDDLERAHERIEAQLGLLPADPDEHLLPAPLLEGVEKVGRRRRKQPSQQAASPRAAAVSPPATPLSNRGVRSHGGRTDSPRRKAA